MIMLNLSTSPAFLWQLQLSGSRKCPQQFNLVSLCISSMHVYVYPSGSHRGPWHLQGCWATRTYRLQSRLVKVSQTAHTKTYIQEKYTLCKHLTVNIRTRTLQQGNIGPFTYTQHTQRCLLNPLPQGISVSCDFHSGDRVPAGNQAAMWQESSFQSGCVEH